MSDLIKIEINENQEPIVNGRELYEALDIKTPYTQWFERMKEYGFTENVDFISLSQNCEKPQGGRPEINHAIKLDMAKEIAMIQRNKKGKEVRQYFIQVEKDFNSLEKIMARALNKKLHDLKVQFKQGHQWFLYKEYHNCGYTHSETIEYKHKDGTTDVTMNTKWTQKGRLFLYDLLKNNGLIPVIER